MMGGVLYLFCSVLVVRGKHEEDDRTDAERGDAGRDADDQPRETNVPPDTHYNHLTFRSRV